MGALEWNNEVARPHSERETFRRGIKNPVCLSNRGAWLGVLGYPTFDHLQLLNSNFPIRELASLQRAMPYYIPLSTLMHHYMLTLQIIVVRGRLPVASFRPKASVAHCFHSRNSTDAPLVQMITCKLHITPESLQELRSRWLVAKFVAYQRPSENFPTSQSSSHFPLLFRGKRELRKMRHRLVTESWSVIFSVSNTLMLPTCNTCTIHRLADLVFPSGVFPPSNRIYYARGRNARSVWMTTGIHGTQRKYRQQRVVPKALVWRMKCRPWSCLCTSLYLCCMSSKRNCIIWHFGDWEWLAIIF